MSIEKVNESITSAIYFVVLEVNMNNDPFVHNESTPKDNIPG